jgi:hypothetical protein
MKWINCGQAPRKIALLSIGVFIHFLTLLAHKVIHNNNNYKLLFYI